MTMSSYPMERAGARPLDPPPGLKALEPIDHVEIWDGSTPWIVRTNSLYRELIADPRVSNDIRREGYPAATAAFKHIRSQTFDRRDDEEHATMRRILNKELSVKNLEPMRASIEADLAGILDEFLTGDKPGDIVNRVAFPFTMRILCRFLGVPHEDLSEFEQIISSLVHTTGIAPEEVMAAHDKFKVYVKSVVEAAKTEPREGVISRLVQDHLPAGTFTEDEIVATCILLFMGGFETSANSISLGTLALLHTEGQWEDLCANYSDRGFVARAVEEILRYTSITHLGRRRVARDKIDIAGVTIRKGEGIIFLEDMSNRDPDAFDGDLDVLDIRRDARRHVAFSAGPHHCVGNQLARMELQTYFRAIAERVPQLRLAIPFEDVQFRKNSQVHGLEELPVIW